MEQTRQHLRCAFTPSPGLYGRGGGVGRLESCQSDSVASRRNHYEMVTPGYRLPYCHLVPLVRDPVRHWVRASARARSRCPRPDQQPSRRASAQSRGLVQTNIVDRRQCADARPAGEPPIDDRQGGGLLPRLIVPLTSMDVKPASIGNGFITCSVKRPSSYIPDYPRSF
jgi:hypothetical protein